MSRSSASSPSSGIEAQRIPDFSEAVIGLAPAAAVSFATAADYDIGPPVDDEVF